MNDLQSQLQNLKNQTNGYSKPPKTFEEQLVHLKKKNLIITNETYTLKKLSHINYYRLSAYFLPLQHQKRSELDGIFLDDVRFEDILELYFFDAELRKTVFKAIESIEVYFRTQIAYHHSLTYGAFGYLDPANFKTSADFFDKVMLAIRKETGRSSETFIAHFKEKYNTTDLPVWTMVEVVSMSTLSKIYAMLKTSEQQAVTQALHGVSKDLFHNWFHALTVIRNICAHHSRLWNKTLGVSFEKPRKIKEFHSMEGDKVFFALSVIAYILDAIGEESDFKNDIESLIATHPKINIKAMGFVDRWELMAVWE
ncbi:MAG: Abi family protein [Sulfuricurvum sp.]|uniref:Abi family protein n=1 Tax=Sulfuricurvum sp. TaxID=2025608 RepID=UPI00261E1904|nr:Abi family protein [Sulfuricurvum sp.]MDD5160836.1 Abi family protein [Sulfuricurvum sp.]